MVLLGPGETKVSMIGRAPSWSSFPVVNCMCGTSGLICCSRGWLCFPSCMTKCHPYTLAISKGVWGRAKALDFKLFHKQVGNEGGKWKEPIAAPWACSYYLPWKRKYVFLRPNSSSVTICCMDMLVLWGSSGSWCNLCLSMVMKGSSGTEVKRALTSYNIITSPGSSFTVWKFCTKYWVFLRWCGD